jgi:S-DNA-T family DNA segregation ATPase FtsK/SpoIIIE
MANRLKSDRKKPDPSKLAPEPEPKVPLKDVVRDERTRKIAGAGLLLLSFFLFVAFTSYLFTWAQDQDKVRGHGIGILMPNNLEIANLLGSFGAYVSHVFMYEGFGLASFLFCSLFFVLGANLLFNRQLFSVKRNIKYLLTGLIVLSVSFAFIFSGASFRWGGELGNQMSQWLTGFIGKLGTAMLIFVSLLSYVIWRFNPVFHVPDTEKWKNLFTRKKPAQDLLPDDEATQKTDSVPESPLASKGKNRLKKEPRVDITEISDAEIEEEEDAPEFILTEKKPEQVPQDHQRFQPEPIAGKPVEKMAPIVSSLPLSDLPLEIKGPATPEEEAVDEANADKAAKLAPYDPVLDLRDYKYPTLDLLEQYSGEKIVMDPNELETHKNQIINTLKNYDIEIQKIFATVGPTVTLYEIVPAAGVRISRIKNLEDDIALSLSALGIRIIAPIPGKGTIGIEVPNVKKSIVSMKTLLASEKFQNNHFSLPVALGKRIDNENFIVDLATMPHLLMAGATGQGKSVGVNAILVSLLYKKHPSQLKFVLVDPKKVELSLYRTIEKHFLAKLPGEEESIITDTKKVVNTLNALCIEMDNRYDLLKEASCRNIREYNEKFVSRRLNPEKGHQYLPFIVLVIDEFADLIMTAGKEIEMPIARLAQLARAVGIHLIIATQRPSVNIITGTIKANFPARIAFKVSSKIDSRTILDNGGAEQLIGRGDMLISYNGEITRLQCVFVDTPEVERVVDSIGKQRGYPQAFMLPEYIDEKEMEGRDFDLGNKDPLFEEAARLIVQSQIGSTSLLQRRMKLGYNRAGRLMDQLETAGIVGPSQGSKVRDVLYKTEADLQQFLETMA